MKTGPIERKVNNVVDNSYRGHRGGFQTKCHNRAGHRRAPLVDSRQRSDVAACTAGRRDPGHIVALGSDRHTLHRRGARKSRAARQPTIHVGRGRRTPALLCRQVRTGVRRVHRHDRRPGGEQHQADRRIPLVCHDQPAHTSVRTHLAHPDACSPPRVRTRGGLQVFLAASVPLTLPSAF